MGGSRRTSEKHSGDSQGNKNVESESKFSEEEDDLISRLYKLLGERWSLIAGRIPGRTPEEIEKYWKKRNSND